MDYNTTRPRLKMQAYGRNVQNMVEKCIEIEDAEERQFMAERIIDAMAVVSQQNLRNPENQKKLWNHLAYLADYKLEVEYPCEIEKL